MPEIIDELYEGLPDDAGLFEREDGYVLKTRTIKGTKKPMWVMRVGGREHKITPTKKEIELFLKWKAESMPETETKKTPRKAKNDEPFEAPFSVNDDGKAIEIWGTMVDASVIRHEPDEDGDGREYCTMEITIGDMDGEMHTIEVGKGGVANLIQAHDAAKWMATARPFHDANEDEQDEEIDRLIKMQKVLFWRVLKAENRKDDIDMPYLLSVRTKDWVKVTVEDIKPRLIEALEEKEIPYGGIEMTRSDGITGGRIKILFDKKQLFKPYINIDAGRFTGGGQSLRVHGGVSILSCTNQLTSEVRQEILSMLAPDDVRTRIIGRKVHRGEYDNIMEIVADVADAINDFGEIIVVAKDTRLSHDMAVKILDYYEAKGILSKKVRARAEEYLGNDEIEQEPGTYFGLAMILSYLGTHGELKDGVSRKLGNLAGEIAIVAKHSRKFATLVNETIEAHPIATV